MGKKTLFFDYKGINDNLAGHCKRLGLDYDRVHARIRRGWSLKDAVETPFKEYLEVVDGCKFCPSCEKTLEVSCFRSRDDRKGIPRTTCIKCDNLAASHSSDKKRCEIINHYSNGANCCAICQEKRMEVLDLDHINCDGWEKRKSGVHTQKLFAALIKQNFPDGFRILCRNCNWIEYLKYKRRGTYREGGHFYKKTS